MGKYYWKKLTDHGYGRIEVEGSDRVYRDQALADKLNEYEAEIIRFREENKELLLCVKPYIRQLTDGIREGVGQLLISEAKKIYRDYEVKLKKLDEGETALVEGVMDLDDEIQRLRDGIREIRDEMSKRGSTWALRLTDLLKPGLLHQEPIVVKEQPEKPA